MDRLILLIGIIAVGFSGPFNSLVVGDGGHGWTGFQVASSRLVLAALVLTLVAPRLNAAQKDRWGGDITAGGLWLAVHFALWTGAFAFTSLYSAVMCLAAQPLISMLLVPRHEGEKPSVQETVGMLLGTMGLALITWQDLELDWRHALGDGMVVAASYAIVRYQLKTRNANRALPAMTFNAAVWGRAGLILMPFGLWNLSSASPEGWPVVIGLVLLPTLVGHGSFNRVIPRLPLMLINVAILAEPVLGVLIGWMMKIEKKFPEGFRLAGMVLVLTGVAVALFSTATARQPDVTDS